MNCQWTLFSGLLATFSLFCCIPVSKIPMETVHFKSSPAAKRHSLEVFHPGRESAARSFGDEGLDSPFSWKAGSAVLQLGLGD